MGQARIQIDCPSSRLLVLGGVDDSSTAPPASGLDRCFAHAHATGHRRHFHTSPDGLQGCPRIPYMRADFAATICADPPIPITPKRGAGIAGSVINSV